MNCIFRIAKNSKNNWLKMNESYITNGTYIYNSFGKKISSEEVLIEMLKCKKVSEIVSYLKTINGNYAGYISNGCIRMAFVDKTRSIPLFYIKSMDTDINIILTDKLTYEDVGAYGLNQKAVQQFMSSLCVFGKETLLRDTYQLLSGEYIDLNLNNGSFISKKYYIFSINCENNHFPIPHFSEVDEIFIKAFKRLIIFASGRDIVVPLSGGADSRLILYYLTRLGYKNLISFSYGRSKENLEVKTAERVAKELRVKWHFVKYEKTSMCKLYRSEGKDFFEFTSSMVSLPHIQDWYAVKYLKDNKIIKNNSIFVPGHTGDFISGGHLLPKFYEQTEQNPSVLKDELTIDIMRKHCQLINFNRLSFESNYSTTKSIIEKEYFTTFDSKSMVFASQIYEHFNWRERQAKYIINSCRTYEYYGYSWCLPLWDESVVNFWVNLPVDLRINRNFFITFTKTLYMDQFKNVKFITPFETIRKNDSRRYTRYIEKFLFWRKSHYMFDYFSFSLYYKMLAKRKTSDVRGLINFEFLKLLEGHNNV